MYTSHTTHLYPLPALVALFLEPGEQVLAADEVKHGRDLVEEEHLDGCIWQVAYFVMVYGTWHVMRVMGVVYDYYDATEVI